MPLSSDPSITLGTQGNVTPVATPLAANAASAGATVDFSANKLGGKIAFTVTFGGAVSATAGALISAFPAGDSAPNFDSTTPYSRVIAAAAGQTRQGSLDVPLGVWKAVIQNLDPTNSFTYGITSSPIA